MNFCSHSEYVGKLWLPWYVKKMDIEYTWILWQGGKCSQFRLCHLLVSLFFQHVWEGMGLMLGRISLFYPATSITLLECMIILYNIQVIIYPLYIKPEYSDHVETIEQINNNSNMRKLLSNKNFTCSFFIQFFFIQTYKNI